MSAYVKFIDDALSYVSINPGQAVAAALFAVGVCSCGFLWEGFKKYSATRKLFKQVNSLLSNKETADAIILSLLRKYMYLLTTSRILVFKYHNGDEDAPHFGNYSKMSCLYEVTAPGFKQLKSIYQNLPLSAYALCSEQMFTEGSFYVTDILKLKNRDRSTYEAAIKNRARCFTMRAIKDSTGLVWGYVIVEFNRPVTFGIKMVSELDIFIEQLQSLLNIR